MVVVVEELFCCPSNAGVDNKFPRIDSVVDLVEGQTLDNKCWLLDRYDHSDLRRAVE